MPVTGLTLGASPRFTRAALGGKFTTAKEGSSKPQAPSAPNSKQPRRVVQNQTFVSLSYVAF
jgi:hypothetical protein